MHKFFKEKKFKFISYLQFAITPVQDVPAPANMSASPMNVLRREFMMFSKNSASVLQKNLML
jgi:hypothetical protein